MLHLTRLNSLRIFWRPTGRLTGTKRELATNAVLAPLKHNHNNWW